MRARTATAFSFIFGSACFGTAVLGACGSDDASGDCADFSGHYELSGSCEGGGSITSSSDVTQSGCHLTIDNDDGTTEEVNASGNKVAYTESEEDVTANCTLTLAGTSVTLRCDYTTTAGDTGTCDGTGTRTPAGSGTGGSTSGSGGSSNAGGTSSGDCGDLVWSDDPESSCQSCMDTSCCAELAACGSGTACEALYECIFGSCPTIDQTCIQEMCGEEVVAGGDDFTALDDCNTTQCDGC